MSSHNGHTNADGMVSDDNPPTEGSGFWSKNFSDDSDDFGADGSGSGDGYSGKFQFKANA